MNCSTCGDVGIVRLNFQEGDEYGICLCPMGERMRARHTWRGRQADIPVWRVWCAREQVDPALVRPIEDVLGGEELAARGFHELAPAETMDAVAAAARNRGAR